jgi:hypothetical protein
LKIVLAGIRIIPRLDIKGSNLIKGIHLEGLRVVGDPHAFALVRLLNGQPIRCSFQLLWVEGFVH